MRTVVLFLLWPLALSAQTAKAEDLSTIEGRVLNAITGEPVGKVSLLLMRTDSTRDSFDWTRSYSASTDSAGKFAIRNIDPGKYRLRATRNGFVTREYGARGSQRSGTVLDLAGPQGLKDIELRLTPHGVIAGRVLDAEGEPLDRAQVQLLRSGYVNGKKVLSTANTTYTNDLGEYRWSGLVAGRYYIYAENFEGIAPATTDPEEYVPTYYLSAIDAGAAVPLDLAAGAQVRAGDILLRKAKTVTVKGKVAVGLPGASGTPMVYCSRSVGHNNRAASTFRVLPARVTAAGEFETRNVTPGPYTVFATIGKGGRSYASPATPLEVGGTNIEGIVLRIDAGLSLTGRIRLDGDAKLDSPNLRIRFQRGGPTAAPLNAESARVADDRTFKFDDLAPALYGVTIEGLPDGFYTKSVRSGEADVTYAGVDLTSGAAGQVEILVSPKARRVSGVAQDADGKSSPGATVVLVPQEKERIPIPAFYQQATTDQYGRFTFKSVPPGDYKVYAWDDVEPTAWMDPDFMKPLEDKGEAVTVAEGAQVNVQVNLTN